MARVTVSDVFSILPDGTTLTDPKVISAIDGATCMVDAIASFGLTAACLKQVEKYLAAHFAAVTENTLTISSETDSCSDSKATYGFVFGEGVKGTPFGIMANSLSNGLLAEMDKQPVSLHSIGSI